MSSEDFGLQIGEWVRKVKHGNVLIFRESVLELVRVLNRTVPVDTGFLRASLAVSKTRIPLANLTNPERDLFQGNFNEVEFILQHITTTDSIYIGYRANYWAYVHYGSNGNPGRPWIALAVQRWPSIVAKASRDVKQRLAL